jgi:rare lipoprotein A
MNQRILTSLTAAVITAAFGTSITNYDSSAKAVASNSEEIPASNQQNSNNRSVNPSVNLLNSEIAELVSLENKQTLKTTTTFVTNDISEVERANIPDLSNNSSNKKLQTIIKTGHLKGTAQPLQGVAGKPNAKVENYEGSEVGVKQINGRASWYGPGFHGRRTANGERYNQYGYTAAHRTLPLGTKVRVTNVRNGKSVVVRINDRGPFIGGRVIDLSAGAAKAIGMIGSGVAQVRIEVLGR